jgi:hypothetical protein
VIVVGKITNMILDFRRRHPGGIAWRVRSHAKVLEEYVNPDEKVLYAFCAQKNEGFSEIFHTYAIAITNKRILLGQKRLLFGSFYHTITPDLYNDMQVYRGMIWGKIVIDTVKELVVLSNLPKNALDEIETTISEFMMEAKKQYKNENKKD